MMIQGCEITPYQLPLSRSWVTHQGKLEQRSGWLIKLKSGMFNGVGDCAPLASAGTETQEEARAWLEQHIQQFNDRDVELLLESLDTFKAPPAARCGIETALIDLLAKQAGLSIARWLNADAASQVQVNANLGKLDDTLILRLNEASGYRVIKLKLGMAPIEQELVWLQQLSAALPAGVSLRLDANRAWPMEQAAEFIASIASLPIESIEEPLAEPTLETLRQLQQGTAIPLALDESFTALNWQAVMQQPPVKRITLKPMVMGGLLPSMALAAQADKAGMAVIVTSTIDSAVGVWAATHLAAALGEKAAQLAHGLATSQWLASDIAQPPLIQQGIIHLPG